LETVLAATLAALLSGAGGAYLATWLRIRHEREEAFRERLLVAADDFATGILQAILAVRDVSVARVDHDPDWATPDQHHHPDVEAASEEARRRIDQAHARLARVELLFGRGSAAGEAAGDLVTALRQALEHIREWPRPDAQRYSDEMNRAHALLDQFGGAVRIAIGRTSPPLTAEQEPRRLDRVRDLCLGGNARATEPPPNGHPRVRRSR
jgi:hypothetical protein